jgi:hypothetical protein
VRASPFLLVGGVLAAVGVLVAMLYTARMPLPAALNRYDCGLGDLVLSYTPGGSVIRIASGTATIEGRVGPDNRITWGTAQPPGATLGNPLPQLIAFADATRLGLRGENELEMSCHKR